MNFPAVFIARPVATTLLTIGIALAGAFAYPQLPVAPLPQVDFPTISVQATLPGASPDTVATSVAAPLERHLGQIADVTEMTSSSSLGQTRITLQFGLDRDIDGAARDVQAALNAAHADLPTSLRSNPTYHKVNPADAPILILALTSATLTRGQLYDAADTILLQKLSQLPGVGEVDVSGIGAAGRPRRAQSRRAVQIWHRPRGRPRGARLGQREQPEGRDRGGRPALPDLYQRPGEQGRAVHAAGGRLPQQCRGASLRRRGCSGFGRRPAQPRSCQRQGRGARHHLSPARREYHRNRRRRESRVADAAGGAAGAVDIMLASDRSTTIRGSLARHAAHPASSRSAWSFWSCSPSCATRARR